MGYYTTYIVKQEDSISDWIDDDVLNTALAELVEDWAVEIGHYTDTIKWYDHDLHMAQLSKRFPNTLFSIEGDGEEQGDHWKMYWCNGISVYGKIKNEFEWPEGFNPRSFFNDNRVVKKFAVSEDEAKAAKALLEKYAAERAYK